MCFYKANALCRVHFVIHLVKANDRKKEKGKKHGLSWELVFVCSCFGVWICKIRHSFVVVFYCLTKHWWQAEYSTEIHKQEQSTVWLVFVCSCFGVWMRKIRHSFVVVFYCLTKHWWQAEYSTEIHKQEQSTVWFHCCLESSPTVDRPLRNVLDCGISEDRRFGGIKLYFAVLSLNLEKYFLSWQADAGLKSSEYCYLWNVQEVWSWYLRLCKSQHERMQSMEMYHTR